MTRINQSISNNTESIRALTDSVPALQLIMTTKEDQASNSSENTKLIDVMKEIRETNLRIYGLGLVYTLCLWACL